MPIKPVGSKPRFDVLRTVKLVQEYQTGYALNRSKLQAWLDSTDFRQYPLFWPGGYADKKHHLFDSTITIPTAAGLRWEGMGLQDPDGYSGNDTGSFICNRGDNNATTFDGTSVKLTSSGAGTTCIVVGRTVTARDLYGAVKITGGTNVTAGWYGITAVNTGSNTWTLSGVATGGTPTTVNWCTGAVTDGTGFYSPTLVQNKAYGFTADGLSFTGKVLQADTLGGQVLWHNLSSTQAGASPGGHQTVFRNCGFGNANVGVLGGVDMAGAYGEEYAGWTSEWVGRTATHADTDIFQNCIFSNLKTAYYRRNQNGVWASFRDCRFSNVQQEVFRFDAGGQLSADTLWISGTGSGTRQCLLTLGRGVSSNMNPFLLSKVFFDHATDHPQLLVAKLDGASQGDASVVIDGAKVDAIDETSTVLDDYPLIDIAGGVALTLRGIVGPNTAGSTLPFWAGCMKLNAGFNGYKPTVLLDRCQINLSDPTTMVDEANSVSGCKVIFRDCYKNDYTLHTNQTYTTT